MGQPAMEDLEFLTDVLNRHPLESLKKIAEEEGVDYYRLKRLYDKYYGKYLRVTAHINIKVIGLRSYIAILGVPADRLMETTMKIVNNPFAVYVNPAFGFKNGLFLYLHIPDDQKDKVGELLRKYSEDYEYYEARAYKYYTGDENFGSWNLSYEYAVLLDILKTDARTPITEIARALGKSRPTIRYMIDRLKKEGILFGYYVNIENDVQDRAVLGLTRELDPVVLEKFREHDIIAGVLPGYGYMLEWFFSSKDDLGSKILEFSNYVEKILVEYLDPTYNKLNEKNFRTRFSRMVKKDGSGYRSILEF